MRKQNALTLVVNHIPSVALDPTHCRAICDEIGERLHFMLKPVTTDMPPRLEYLISRLAEREQRELLPTVRSPSIAPVIDELTLAIERAIEHAD
jgi:hypothetical protein